MSWDEIDVPYGAAETEPVQPWRIPMPDWTRDPDVQRDIRRIWRTTGIDLPWPKRREQGALVIQRVWAKDDDYDVIKHPPGTPDSIAFYRPSWLSCLCRVVGKIHSHGGRGRDGKDPFRPSDGDLATSVELGVPGVIVTYPANPDEEYQLIPYDGRNQ